MTFKEAVGQALRELGASEETITVGVERMCRDLAGLMNPNDQLAAIERFGHLTDRQCIEHFKRAIRVIDIAPPGVPEKLQAELLGTRFRRN
jgi:hypothetical protein